VTLQTRLSGAATQGIAGEAPAKDLLLTTLGNMSSFSWQFRPPPYSKPWPWCSTPSVLTATRQSAGDVRKLWATWVPVQPTSHLPTVVTSKVTSCNCKIKYLSILYISWKRLTFDEARIPTLETSTFVWAWGFRLFSATPRNKNCDICVYKWINKGLKYKQMQTLCKRIEDSI
jgi:hypothetical protein